MIKKKADINTDPDFVPRSLTEETFGQGLHFLSDRDPDLAQILTKFGPPPMWAREPGFPTLILIILEQQVSLASARAAYDRLREAASPLTPVRFLELDDAMLKAIGFSRQKTAYGRGLAKTLVDGHLDLVKLAMMPDTKVRAELIKVKGIGPWTADIYLLMALRRPDIMPSADLALLTPVQKVKRLASRPTPDELNTLSKNWKPWRSVAARILWHYYLNGCIQLKTA
jgi:DNA-3-methyladenine glycosylase II